MVAFDNSSTMVSIANHSYTTPRQIAFLDRLITEQIKIVELSLQLHVGWLSRLDASDVSLAREFGQVVKGAEAELAVLGCILNEKAKTMRDLFRLVMHRKVPYELVRAFVGTNSLDNVIWKNALSRGYPELLNEQTCLR